MRESLTLHHGALYVGHSEKTAHVEVFDLDGHRLPGRFSFRDESVSRSSVEGIAVDDDHRLWIADGAARKVRVFTAFGREVAALPCSEEDRAGLPGRPVDLEVEGDSDGGTLLIAGEGERRHGLTLFDLEGVPLASLRPEGRAEGRFRGLRGVARRGRWVWAAEHGRGRVQVFRDGEFHFAFSLAARGGFRPTAVAPLEDGRLVVATDGETSSALLLVDGAGRLLCPLAGPGEGDGEVQEPTDVVVHEGDSDRSSRVLAIDLHGLRVQVFDLEGRAFGAFTPAWDDVLPPFSSSSGEGRPG